MLCRPEPVLLYLGGGQLVAAFSLGSLWVAVDQHPLELELERNNNAIRSLWNLLPHTMVAESEQPLKVLHLSVLC